MTDDTDRPDLPPGWRWAPFGEITDHRLGKMLDKRKNEGTPRPYLRNVNVRWHGFDLSDVKEMRVGDDEMGKYTIRRGDLVICEGGEPGRAAIWKRDGPMVYQKAVHRARPHEGVEASYLLYFLEHAARSGQLAEHFTGSTINHLTGRALAAVHVPLAPTDEQRRIVDAVESVFADLDAGVAALTEARAGLDRYRQSVLKAAIEGALTADWRAAHPDAEPASALLARVAGERRAQWEADQLAKYEAKGKMPPKSFRQRYTPAAEPKTDDLPALPEGWAWSNVEQLGEVKSGLTKNKSKSTDEWEEVPYLRVANVQRGYLDLSEIKSISAPQAKIETSLLEHGDVLFNEGGDIDKLGRGWIWEGQLPRCSHQNHVFRVRLYMSAIDPKLVSWVGNTRGQSHFLEHGKQTTNLASINQGTLKSLPIPLPPLGEQTAIVEAVEQRLSVTDAVAAEIDRQLARAERLRQSVLQQAFTGKLVAQDATELESVRLGDTARTAESQIRRATGTQVHLDFGS